MLATLADRQIGTAGISPSLDSMSDVPVGEPGKHGPGPQPGQDQRPWPSMPPAGRAPVTGRMRGAGELAELAAVIGR
jgi:hypothetical protein